MAIDAYVKFGESKDKSPLYDTPLPAIEGDSDDSEHHWWCELRECGFDLESRQNQPKEKGSDNKDVEKAGFKPVRLRKRVDWGSSQLFLKCCEAAEASAKKTDDKEKGLIDVVTIHICRPGGEKKVPFVIVRYYNVKVTNFKLGMAEAESSEEITFEFEELELEYQPTNPYTNLPKGQPLVTRPRLRNFPPKEPSPAATAGGQGGVTAPAIGTGGTATVTSPAGGTGNSGSSGSLASSIDLGVHANFPGAASLNGPGVLP